MESTDGEDLFIVCEHCLADNAAREEVVARGIIAERCPICFRNQARTLTVDDPLLRRILRALVREHFSEWEYNHHVGGESLSSLLFGRNPIFDLNAETADALEFDSVVSIVEDGWYPADENQIALGGGYWDGVLLDSVRWGIDRRLYRLLASAFAKNWYDVLPALRPLVDEILPDTIRDVPAQSTFYRARLGVEKRLVPEIPKFRETYAYRPHSASALGAPPLHLAGDGRLNRARVRAFYAASDRDTAVAELRPHPGHLVSVGRFSNTRSLRFADLTVIDIRQFLSDTRLESLRLVHSFERLLNIPVQPERKEPYVVTQLLADAFRVAGAEGVIFRSTLGTGTNIASFDVNAFTYCDNSTEVIEVRSLQYALSNASVPSAADASDWKEDLDNPLTTLYAGIAPR